MAIRILCIQRMLSPQRGDKFQTKQHDNRKFLCGTFYNFSMFSFCMIPSFFGKASVRMKKTGERPYFMKKFLEKPLSKSENRYIV